MFYALQIHLDSAVISETNGQSDSMEFVDVSTSHADEICVCSAYYSSMHLRLCPSYITIITENRYCKIAENNCRQ